MAQLAIAWCMKFKYLSTALTGARNVKQLEDNIKSLEVYKKLTNEIEERINKILDNNPAPRYNFAQWGKTY